MKITDHSRCRLYAVIIFMMSISFCSMGQETTLPDPVYDPGYIYPGPVEKADRNVLKTPEIKKVSFSFSTGMMLSAGDRDNALVTGYVAPAVAFTLSPRLRVRAGGILPFNPFSGHPQGSSTYPGYPKGIVNRTGLFIAADYRITDRFMFTGAYYKFPGYSMLLQESSPEVMNRRQYPYAVPSESISLGLNYEISKGITVGAEVRFSDRYQPFLNPFLPGPGFSPYDQIYW